MGRSPVYGQIMPRYALKIEYDGGPFSGWQRQKQHPSVQQAIEDALAKLENGAPTMAAAGRTDAGVHAIGQVAHCDLAAHWDPFRLSEALNFHLKPAPVAIMGVAQVADDWHARFSATGRQYHYRIINRRPPLVHDRGLAWRIGHELALEPMQQAARYLVGQHDFTTFRSSECQAASPVKTLDALEVSHAAVSGGTEFRFDVRARSFLHNQVRSMVGTLERVGAGAWTPQTVKAALEAHDRAACGPVCPGAGLYLAAVTYPVDPFA